MKVNILVIDDDKLIHKIINSQLGKTFDLVHAYNGDEGITLAEQNPDLILLDVEMPGRNGYEVCELLKQKHDCKHIPVIFLSANSSVRQIMLGYEAGADDYIAKPFDKDVLIAKIHVLLKITTEGKKLADDVKEAQDAAMEALTGSSELGQVMQFIEQSYGIHHTDVLSNHFFALTRSLSLNCSMLIHIENNNELFSSKGMIKPLEGDLLKQSRNNNRFIDFGCRTIINYPRVSVLIKNMPLDDDERYGRYKDLFPAILGALDAKIQTIEDRNNIVRHAQKLTESFQQIKQTLVNLASALNSNNQRNFSVLQIMYETLLTHVPNLGLEDDQEQYILDTVQQAIDSVRNETLDTDDTNKALARILLAMQKLVEEQNKVVEEVKKDQIQEHIEPKSDSDDDYQMDVELF